MSLVAYGYGIGDVPSIVTVVEGASVEVAADSAIVFQDDPSVVAVASDPINVVVFDPGPERAVKVDTKALDFASDERLLNSTDHPLGIANVWSIQMNLEPRSEVLLMQPLLITQSSGNGNQISVDLRGNIANDPFRIIIRRTNGNALKQYEWNNTYSTGVKVSYLFTWDGTDLLLYIDGVETAPDTMVWDLSSSMTDTARQVAIGAQTGGFGPFNGILHSTSVWNVALTADEVTALHNGGSPQDFDNRFDLGDYTSSANLQHYWRHGFNASDIGEDLGYATTLIDVGDNAVNITADDIVDY